MGKFKFQKIDKKDANKGQTFQKKVAQPTTIQNPSFYYYKDKDYGKNIEDFQLADTYEELFSIDGIKPFELTTTYPGLIVGSGYNHQKLKENKDDYQLGFFFDHTTGLPIISGSSIKGAIRSIFPDKNDRYYEQKIEFLKEEYSVKYTEAMIKELFEDGKIIFHDAYIIDSKNKDKKIFGSDYITSHHSDEEMGEFKEPNPVKFLKILPEVRFRFQFQATQEEVNLFEKILLDFGVGAKTNVGYGQFKKS